MLVSERRIHDHLTEEVSDKVAVLRVRREEALGALSREIVEALGRYVTEVGSRSDVRALVLTGTGRAFVAGADISEYHGASQESFESYQRLSRSVFTALERTPKLTIAAVNGYALGGGFELALCCDLIFASSRAKFGLPEIKLGLIPGGGGTQRLTREAGARFAKEAILSGASYTADELHGRSLVNRVFPPERLLDETLAYARKIVKFSPAAVRAVKAAVDHRRDQELDAGLTFEQSALGALFSTDDAREGIAAFIEKREARFTGT